MPQRTMRAQRTLSLNFPSGRCESLRVESEQRAMPIANTDLFVVRHALGIMLIIGAASFAACDSAPPATAVSENPEPVRQVRVVAAAETETARSVRATGTLAAEEKIILGTKVIGRLAEIGVDLGSHVRKGQEIARIDQSDYRLRVEQASAALQQARVRLGLPPSGNSDRVDIERTATVRQAAAMLKEARLTHERMVELWERKFVARAELDVAVS